MYLFLLFGLFVCQQFNSSDCNPFEQICAGELNCTVPSLNGVTLFSSPSSQTAFQAIGVPINVTWSYREADSRYPLRNVGLYYRQIGIVPFTFITNVGPSVRSTNVTIRSVAPGNYELLVVPDNLDVTQTLNVGNKTSCVREGWPYPQRIPFRLIETGPVTPFSNPFGPNSSASRLTPLVYLVFLLVL